MRTFIRFTICIVSFGLYAQIKVGDNPNILNPHALIELEANDKGFLLTRVDRGFLRGLGSKDKGLLIFDKVDNIMYCWNGSAWVPFSGSKLRSGLTDSDNQAVFIGGASATKTSFGIGVEDPIHPLHIDGNGNLADTKDNLIFSRDGNLIIGDARNNYPDGAILQINSDSKGIMLPKIKNLAQNNNNLNKAGMFIYDSAANTIKFSNGNDWVSVGKFLDGTGVDPSDQAVFMASLGGEARLGIGVDNPKKAIHVKGDIQASNTVITNKIQITNGAGPDMFLTSDEKGTGIVEWEPIGNLSAFRFTSPPNPKDPKDVIKEQLSKVAHAPNLSDGITLRPNTDHITMSDKGFLGIKTIDPVKPFHLDGDGDDKTTNDIITMSEKGFLGIRNKNPIHPFHFDGDGKDSTTKDIIVMSSRAYLGIGISTPETGIELSSTDKKKATISINETQMLFAPIGFNGTMAFGDGLKKVEGTTTDGGKNNIAVGKGAMKELTTGYKNIAVGTDALKGLDVTGKYMTGNSNVAIGFNSLLKNEKGNENIAIGSEAMKENTSGNENIALGINALNTNETGNNNIAIGKNTLGNNVSGEKNIAIGNGSMETNTTGINNIAIGQGTLFNLKDSKVNIAIGEEAMYGDTGATGTRNIALGAKSMKGLTTGRENLSLGHDAMEGKGNNISGNFNTVIGNKSAVNIADGSYNIVLGPNSMVQNKSGSDNIVVGKSSLTNGGGANSNGGTNNLNKNIVIGNNSFIQFLTGERNVIIGSDTATRLTSGTNNIIIGSGATIPDGTDNRVQLGNIDITSFVAAVTPTTTSDRRLKENIRSLPYGMDLIKLLRPVDYNRKKDDIGKKEMGLIAQEVEQALNKLGYKESGVVGKYMKYYALRYNDFIPLVIKGIQEQQEQIEKQQKEIDILRNMVLELKDKLDSKK